MMQLVFHASLAAVSGDSPTDSSSLVEDWSASPAPTSPSPPVLTSLTFGCYGAVGTNGQVAVGGGMTSNLNNPTMVSVPCGIASGTAQTIIVSTSAGTNSANQVCGKDQYGNPEVAVGLIYLNNACYVQCASLFTPTSACHWDTTTTPFSTTN